jgi:hypothetical protein
MNFGQLAVGSWQLAVGSWQLAVGSWQLAVGSWQLAVGSLKNVSFFDQRVKWFLTFFSAKRVTSLCLCACF